MPRRLRMVDGADRRTGRARCRDEPLVRDRLGALAPRRCAASARAAGARLVRRRARRRHAADAAAARRTPAAADAAGDAPQLQVGRRVQFRGNRKVEDDAIRVNLKSAAGRHARRSESCATTSARSGRWATSRTCRSRQRGARTASVDLTFVAQGEAGRSARSTSPATTRSASTRSTRSSTSRRTRSSTSPRSRRTSRRSASSTSRRASTSPRSTTRSSAIDRDRGRRLVQRRRERQGRGPRGQVHRQQRASPTTSCATSIATQRGRTRCRSSPTSGTYREDAFERDLLLLQRALLGPRLRQREGRHAAARAVAPTSSTCTSRSRSTRGRQYTIGKVDFKGDLLGAQARTTSSA